MREASERESRPTGEEEGLRLYMRSLRRRSDAEEGKGAGGLGRGGGGGEERAEGMMKGGGGAAEEDIFCLLYNFFLLLLV